MSKCYASTIDWYSKKSEIQSRLEKGGTIFSLAKFYSQDFKTMKRILIHLGFSDMSEKETIDYALDKFINIGPKFPETEKYLRGILRLNPLFGMFDQGIWNLIHRDDYVRLALESQTNDPGDYWRYKFDNLPEIIPNKRQEVTINAHFYTSRVTGEEIWAEKSFDWDIIRRKSSILACKQEDEEDKEVFKKIKIEMFGDKFGREDFEFSIPENKLGIIQVKCKKCGKVFERHFNCLCNDHRLCCPRCSDQKYGDKLTNEEFIERAFKAYGPDRFGYDRVNYVNKRRKVEILDLETGDYFWTVPATFLHGLCKGTLGNSSGERKVKKWLTTIGFKEGTDFIHHYFARELKNCRKTGNLFIDFKLTYNNKIYWIEYNGEQHYKFSNIWKTYDDFLKQVKRDEIVSKHCEETGITLISIPYTYRTYSDISKLLLAIIINDEPVDIIKQLEVKL